MDLFGRKKKKQMAQLEAERQRLDMQRERTYVRENMRLCKNCRAVLSDNTNKCPQCGEHN